MEFNEIAQHLDDEIIRARDPDAFFDLSLSVFAEALARNLHVEVMNGILTQIRDNHLPITADRTSGSFIVLHRTPFSGWSVIFHNRITRYLYLSPINAIQSNIGKTDSVKVVRYRCNRPNDFSVLDRDLSITEIESVTPGKNQIVMRPGSTDILDWRPASDTGARGLTLRLNGSPLESFEWTFSRETNKAIALAPIESFESNLTTLLTLLSTCGNGETVDLVLPLLQHERHFVRWAAAQTIAAIDEEAGLKAIAKLTSDPHPEVRSLARSKESPLLGGEIIR
ncbi:HEAT repeat domain-containing protein [Altererythrobacter sp. Root672]|uniref:HEAT repeat domain-containing protein n=1 Tax=Altererythrobacter sp. Root672 TaxID=1736584 RepID=UPI000AE285B2|nr:HEAT repeat domain-containing protein [Altererythrobacter sp. Root672]